ncbi:MAG: hypothetical protein SNJ67_03970 [Chloracidobacterium sp.]
MKACPKCETLWDDSKRFCPYHGVLLTEVPEGDAVVERDGSDAAKGDLVDIELTVRMSEEERAQLFTPQFPPPPSPLATPSPASVTDEAPFQTGREAERPDPALPFAPEPLPPSSFETAAYLEDPPTAKSGRVVATAEPPPDAFDPFIPPTVIVAPAALPPESRQVTPPPRLDVVIPPTVVVASAEAGLATPSQLEGGVAGPAATSRLADDFSPLTVNPGAAPTTPMDASATHVHLNLPMPSGPRPPVFPPELKASDVEDDVGFILDLGEKSSARLTPPPVPAAVESPQPPAGRSLTPSAVPSLVPPVSPTIKRLTAVQYFKLFNERKKVIQQFVQQLDPKKAQIAEGHSNQEDLLLHRYDLTFRALHATRTFPLVIILQRKPVYGLLTSIDLYEIAESQMLREERTKSLGGDCKSTPNGVLYYLSYAEDLPTEQFGDWLRAKFQAIVGLIPGASL